MIIEKSFSITATLIVTAALFFSASSCKDNNNPDNGGDGSDTTAVTASDVELYVTSSNKSFLFTKVDKNFNTKPNLSPYTIKVDKNTEYQKMKGFGAAITGSTAYNLLKMTEEDRSALLERIFDPDSGMGYSYIRISIGCSDFSLDEYTCCDKEGIDNFGLNKYDKRDLVPVLKEILAINPDIGIMASPWTAPRWMKVNNIADLTSYPYWTGGHVDPKYYDDYATYFVKFIEAMAAEGITITSISPQNEPLNAGNSASTVFTATEERDFIKVLGPKLKDAGLNTEIWCYDHNYDVPDYPLTIYADEEASKWVSGSAWHAYSGDVSTLYNIHAAYPDKGIYFTEQSIGSWGYSFDGDLMWNMENCGLGVINYGGSASIMWNLLLDDNGGPYRPNGCSTCYGAIVVSSSNYKTLTYNSHYYTMGHLAKVIRPGAYRIASSGYTKDGLSYAAFLNPDGSYGFVAQNDNDEVTKIVVDDGIKSFSYSMPEKSIASFRWKDN
ncbi:MAG: glucosylceramidase [Bacteroidales bacterium]|jgi:glucosylceramidase|nr:glucosylceramidase [Bacteroidales bacterium]MCI2121506.1 glucosylceramidase [Bacteroidales bacterium]MCI2145129.1 glucosylceramidase [Bacteroidales bacterium]